MKIIADDKIPCITDFFSQADELVLMPGEEITRKDLLDANALITRTVTQINAKLLENTTVCFVGSATTGTDHIDETWLAAHHIHLATAAGANADAVAEYVTCCFAALKKQGSLDTKKRVGIIGYGCIGRIVALIARDIGLDVQCYDPFLADTQPFQSVSFEALIRTSDIISIHAPLTKTGSHPTFHLIHHALIKHIKPDAILINTARGEVCDQAALLNAKNITLCLDVWENEPLISLELLKKVFIGTPHIAGYSHSAKYRATQMIYESAAAFFGWPMTDVKITLPATTPYDPVAHTKQFREKMMRCDSVEAIKKCFLDSRIVVR